MKIKKTPTLPSVDFIEDEGILKIEGRSIDTDSKSFWTPIYEKIDKYMDDPRDIVFTLDLEFFNTSSAKYILELLNMMKKKMSDSKRKLLVKWFYDDDDLKEAGIDFETILKFGVWKHIKK